MKIGLMDLMLKQTKNIDIIKKMILEYDNLPEEDIKKYLVALENCEYNYYALLIATNSDIAEKRTVEEQIKLMNTLKECEYDENALWIAINPDILEKRTIEEQIRLMKTTKTELKQDGTHSDNLDKIKTYEELSEYINNLQKKYGNETDIKLDDIVKVYKKTFNESESK